MKEARASEIQAKNLASGKKNKEPGLSKVLKARGEASYYKVTCKVSISLFILVQQKLMFVKFQFQGLVTAIFIYIFRS